MPKLVASDIATALKKRISSGEWIENGRIPPERDLASEFGVARNTMRRAVSFLEDDGTVVRHVGRGTFLTAPNPASMTAVVGRMEGTSPADMMEIRQLLEPAAASFAATNASAMELNAVREAHRIACESQDMPTFEHWDAEFHHRIFACSRNEFLKEIHNLMRILRNQAPWFEMKKRSFSEERRSIYCSEHQMVLDALLRRDPESASQAMLAHLKTVERNLLGR
ncbi:FCD domain-containing protein [Mesorhizobium sp. B2-3-4]|uniref:FadR/GntR family transcriptional regulator n=1 Tax=Mesorhizobium sp. B2-3-4 TaxID=2589959 RepID=UPI0011262906|nr:FCD domain-containing protein [Mesorhizobium sp. B2-3-4]TPM40815.1 FadR family transcriptional regulator [Mesorhizobium sp. B2-3-4]